MKLLDFKKTELLLKKYKIPLIETKIIKKEKEIFDFSKKFGFPIVLKIFSPEIFHRTEKNMIEFANSEKELKEAFKKLNKRVPKKKGSVLLIQKKGEGVELICGIKKDEVFGPVLMFGLGGIFVEAMGNMNFGIAPISKKQALEIIKSIKGFKVLNGYRNLPSVNLARLAGILVQISKLGENYPKALEIDFNPIFANGNKISAADFKIFV